MERGHSRFEQWLDRADRRIVAGGRTPAIALFVLAFIVKAIYVVASAHALEIRVPIMDARYYDQMAQEIVAGGLLRPGAYFMGPLYPYFLALVYETYGRDFLMVRLLQALAGAGTVVLTFHLGRQVFRPVVGLLAALLLCLYGAMTFYEGQMLMMWMGAFLNLSALVVLVSAKEHPGAARYAVAGLLVGLSALARANVLVFVPVAVFWIAGVVGGADRWRRVGVFVAGVVIAVLPATIHNYIASRDLVLVTSNAGLNFYIGNGKASTGIFHPPQGVDFVDDTTTRIHIERKLGRDLKPSEISRYWFSQTLAEMREDPAHAARLLLRKVGLFFNGYEVPQLESFQVARTRYTILRYLFVNFWVLLSLGLLGMAFTVRRWRDYSLLSGFVLAYAVSIIAFFVTARYRVQIAPLLALFAANLVLGVLPRWMNTLRRGAAFVGLFVVVMIMTNPAIFASDTNEVMFREEVHRARRLGEEGAYQAAISEIDRAIERFPDFAEGYIHRAIIHKEAGARLEAIEDYSRALELRPDLASVHYDLAQTLRLVNIREEAVREYMAAIELDPYMIQAHNNLGITLREMGRYAEAAAAFRRVIELDPSYAKGYNNLGAALAESGRVEEAIEVFESATRRFPDYANSWRNLAMANISLKRVDPAIEAITRYIALEPGDADAREVLRKLQIAAKADTSAPSTEQ